MEPTSRSLYVTLLSNTSTPEFPGNTPASFKVRLPHTLRVKNWQVGVAGVYLPGPPNTVSHAVTSHPVSMTTHPVSHLVTHPVPPLTEFRQSNLYRGSDNQRLFRWYVRVFKGVDGTRAQDITVTMEDADMPKAATGVVFLKKVFRWWQQDVMKKLYVGYNLGLGAVDYALQFQWKDKAGVPTLWLLNSDLNVSYNKPRPYLGINVVLAKQMGWLVQKRTGRMPWDPIYSCTPCWSSPRTRRSMRPRIRTNCFRLRITYTCTER